MANLRLNQKGDAISSLKAARDKLSKTAGCFVADSVWGIERVTLQLFGHCFTR